MSRLAAVSPALPPHVYDQAEISAVIGPLLTEDPGRRTVLDRLHRASGVSTRHLVLPLEKYAGLTSFDQANDLFIALGADLAEHAVRQALADADILAEEVDFLLFTSVTGVSAPSIDSLLVERLGLRRDVRRLPSFGWGCAGGSAGVARVHDYLTGHPQDVAVLLSVELCSLTVQQGDDSLANLVSSGLFGDGAAAVVMVGEERAVSGRTAGPRVLGSRSVIYPDSAGSLGWDIGGSGFRIVLSAGMPEVIEEHLRQDVVTLLAEHDLTLGDVTTWVAHTGGPRILEAAARALGVADEAFARSWSSLDRVGNLSSSSVLHVLADTLDGGDLEPGDVGVMFAFGPGVGAEIVLLHQPQEGPG
ncbi:type III polyketide synthase [Actinotalea sp. K2]|uniref:type III polyketide synthase n=1 Tax=Actinotalea sp. K2 TaxID=2939438 RepID=UPI002016F71B|nr:3-oxoacyl-[acyl-carrier-protein] synthase III C-terminal domain-containing protein [Actinotalea sp. K2]MCL3862241.1 type III polyketide synthase [Actinotalea sp. K2]